MRSKKIFPLIFCCIVTHITAMKLSSSKEQHSDSPQRDRSPSRTQDIDKSQPRSASAPAQRNGMSLPSTKTSRKSLRLNSRSDASVSQSESETSSPQLSPRHQATLSQSRNEPNSPVKITLGNYLNPGYVTIPRPGYISTSSKKIIPLFKTTEVKQMRDKIWKITYINEIDESIFLMDADKNYKSIYIQEHMNPRGHNYWVQKDGNFCIELSPPKKPTTINTHKIVGLSLFAAFIVAMLYRDNRLPDISYYILAFNALLKGSGS